MHLVAPLVSGIRGAELGTAELYVRGTTNRAPRYLDFEATQPVTSPPGPISLDSNGAAVIYVNTLVDVVAFDADGVEVRRFTAGDGAPGVEVISRSFTGTDYDTGQQAASKPVPLSTVLDRLKTSFGAIDFNVLFNGSTQTLQAALGSVSNLVFNVKSYGAIGNGVADDVSAIQNAATACHVAGGGIVFFPPGTYRLGTSLSIYSDTSLVGAGRGVSVIKQNHATTDIVTWAGGTAGQISFICNLGFSLLSNNSGNFIHVGQDNVGVHVADCAFGTGGFDATGQFISVDSALAGVTLRVFTSSFVLSAGTTKGIYAQSGAAAVVANDFTAVTTSATPTLVATLAAGGTIALNRFDPSAAVSGSIFAIVTTSGVSTSAIVVGNRVYASGGANVILTLYDCVEAGNVLASGTSLNYGPSSTTASFNQGTWEAIDSTKIRSTVSGATATLTLPDFAGTYYVIITSTVDLTISGPPAVSGRRFRVIIDNQTGVTRGVQMIGSGYTAVGTGTGSAGLNSNSVRVLDGHFITTRTGTQLLLERANASTDVAD